MAATLLTVTDLAARLDTDPRTTRKFLRSITPTDEHPGKGARWEVPATRITSLKSKFKKYQTEIQASKDAKSQDITDSDITSVEVDGVEVAQVTHSDITDEV